MYKYQKGWFSKETAETSSIDIKQRHQDYCLLSKSFFRLFLAIFLMSLTASMKSSLFVRGYLTWEESRTLWVSPISLKRKCVESAVPSVNHPFGYFLPFWAIFWHSWWILWIPHCLWLVPWGTLTWEQSRTLWVFPITLEKCVKTATSLNNHPFWPL